MSLENTAVAVFDGHQKADDAVRALGRANFPVEQLTIVGKGYHTDEQVMGFYNVGDRIKLWGKNGAFWGGLWGLFLGGIFMTLPVIGPVVVLGHLAAMLLGAAEGAILVGGVSALAGALVSVGIPKDSIIRYEEAVKADQFLVMAHGTPDEVARAKDVLHAALPTELTVHEGTYGARAVHEASQRHAELEPAG
ncbi:MAG: DUF1269 domain-containing protein [bacterium]|nr:DUF1269 domain-containing protein [bacterium]